MDTSLEVMAVPQVSQYHHCFVMPLEESALRHLKIFSHVLPESDLYIGEMNTYEFRGERMARPGKHAVAKNEVNIAGYWHERLAGACRQMQIERASLAIQDPTLMLSAGYGNTQVRQFTANKEYAVLCVAKLFTSTLIAQLVARRKLMFASLVTDLLPGAAGTEVLQGVRIEHLLSHMHGLSCTGLNVAPVDSSGLIDTAAVLAVLQAEGRMFASGTFFSYGAAGYILLGSIVEHITRMPFKDVLDEEILSNLPLQSFLTSDTDFPEPETPICPSSGRGLRLSTEELCAFAGDFAGFDEYELALPQALVTEIFAAQQTLPGWSPIFSGCCYGWKNFNNGWYGHNGVENGQLMYVRINPARQTVICLAAETANRNPGALPALLFRTTYPALCLSNARQPRFIIEPAPDDSNAISGSFGRGYLSFHIALQDGRLALEIRTSTSGHTIIAHRCYLRAAEEHIYFLKTPWQNITFLQLIIDEHGRRYLWDHTQLWPEVLQIDV